MSKTGRWMVGAAALMGVAAPAMAKPEAGYRVTHHAKRNHYCVRASSVADAERLGVRLYRTECRSAEGWASVGLTIGRR